MAMPSLVDVPRLRRALADVHYAESIERRQARITRAEAYCAARAPLNSAERTILRSTLRIQDSEVRPDQKGLL